MVNTNTMLWRRRSSRDVGGEKEVMYFDPKPDLYVKNLKNLLFVYRQEILRRLRDSMGMNEEQSKCNTSKVYPSFMRWSIPYMLTAARFHPLPVFLGGCLLFFMAVEYTMVMISADSPPYDVGFIWTKSLHDLLSQRPALNSALAAMNTVFVGMQTTYILWTWLMEGRTRSTIAALFMFTCRGILGYSTQLPVPKGFLGSGVDFPVGNMSFFLFFSGHVAGSMIASLDMRRMNRWQMALLFDTLNILQSLRLLVIRGHYTIDLAAGVGAGWLFDSLAGKYEESKRNIQKETKHEPSLANRGFHSQAAVIR